MIVLHVFWMGGVGVYIYMWVVGGRGDEWHGVCIIDAWSVVNGRYTILRSLFLPSIPVR